jgi:hypothetical protein
MNQAAEEYQRVLASISSIDSSTANRSYEAVGSRHYANFYEAARLATGLFIYPIICIVGLAGNCIALIVLSRPTMMTSYNVILSALAANDIIKLLNDLVYFIDVVLQLVDPRAENVLFGHAYPVSHYICNQVT